jgi:hypothetical protein
MVAPRDCRLPQVTPSVALPALQRAARGVPTSALSLLEDAMYLEPEKCAQCGKNLADSAKHSPHNTDLDGFAQRVFIRPLFCSPAHVRDAAETYVSLKKDAEELQLYRECQAYY